MNTDSHERKQSPRITHISWGRMDVEGLTTGRDFKLYPGGGREWDWTETGTRHEPGIQPADVEELLDHGSRGSSSSHAACSWFSKHAGRR